jgi:hypothetical protein
MRIGLRSVIVLNGRVNESSRLVVIVALVGLLASACSGWRETSHDWALTAIDGSTLSIVVAVGSGSCNRFERVVVEETPEDVTLTAVVGDKIVNPFGGGCTDDLNVEFVDVSLEEPLGERRLLGCMPGADGMQNLFGEARQGNDCAEVIDGW